jgi:hypothetical protein
MPKAKLIKRNSKFIRKSHSKLSENQTPVKRLPNSYRIFLESLELFKTHWRVLGGITLVYAILSLILVQSSAGLGNLDEQTGDNTFSKALNGFNNLISNSSTGDSLMQAVLFLTAGLAIVWAVRRLISGENVSTKQAYYQSMTPLVPVFLLILLFCIQLLPMLLASAGLRVAFGGNSSSTAILSIAGLVFFVLASWWSLFMISRTFVAIFIVSLPGMTPLQAMAKAKGLVKNRRTSIFRKLIFLPVVIFILLGVVLIPIIMIASFLASPLFLLLGPLSLTFSIVYLFVLYQEIIK